MISSGSLDWGEGYRLQPCSIKGEKTVRGLKKLESHQAAQYKFVDWMAVADTYPDNFAGLLFFSDRATPAKA